MSNSFVNYLGQWSSSVQYTGGAPILSLGAPLYLAATAVTYQGVLYITNGSTSPTLGLLPNLDSAWSSATGGGSSGGILEANAAATTNVLISDPGTATFDGITLTNGQVLFLFQQTTEAENGLWTFNGASSALTRAPSMNTWNQVVGVEVLVTAGTQYGVTLWISTVMPGGTLGTTPITFASVAVSPVPIKSGGTGATTQQGAITALTGTQVAGEYLRSDGTNSLLSTIHAADVPGIAGGSAIQAQMVVQTGLNTTGFLTGLSNSLLVTDGTGTPSYSNLLPTGTQIGNGNSLANVAGVGFTYNSPNLVWTQTSLPFSNNWAVVTFGGGSFVALSNGGSLHSAYSNNNGVTWSASVPSSANSWFDCDYGDGVFIAVANASNVTMYSTTGGKTWTNGGLMPTAANWNTVAYSMGLFFAIAGLSTNVAVTSNGGVSWFAGTSLGASLSWIALAANQQGTLVAIASGTNQYTYSVNNGTSWTLSTLPVNAAWTDIEYGGGHFVAIASGTTISVYSTDGITWTAGGALPSTANWDSVTYGNGVWVAVASSSNKSAYSLNNGVTWTAVSLPASGQWYSLFYGNGAFVAISGSSSTVAAYGAYITEPQVATIPGNNQTLTWNDFNNIYLQSTLYPKFLQSGWLPVDGSGAGLSFTVNWATFVQIGTLVYVSAQIIYPSTVNTNAAVINGLPMGVNVSANGIPQVVPVSVTSNATISVNAQATGSSISFIQQGTAFTTVKNNQLSTSIINLSVIYSV